jgi:hypothetical protein
LRRPASRRRPAHARRGDRDRPVDRAARPRAVGRLDRRALRAVGRRRALPAAPRLHRRLAARAGARRRRQDRKAFTTIRPRLAGNLYEPWIQFEISEELAANPPFLLDAFVDVARWKELGVRFGQLRTPFARSMQYAPNEILFPDQPVVASYFVTGRDKGAAAYGTLADALQYWVSLSGGAPVRQLTTISGNYLVEARVTWSSGASLGKTQYPYVVGAGGAAPPFVVSATLEGYVGKIQSAIESFEPSSFEFAVEASGEITRKRAVGGDIVVQGARYAIFAEAFLRRTEPEGQAAYRSWGVWGQASVLLLPETLDAGVRLEYLDPSVDLRDDSFASVEAQVAWYIDAPRLVARLRYGLGHQASPGAAALGDVALPVAFVGTINLFTAQLTLAF